MRPEIVASSAGQALLVLIYLDINDWQLTARDEYGGIVLRETVAASTASGKLTFGNAALKYSRSHPQQFNNKYFYSLAADPLAGDMKPAKNHADLIYHHLVQLALPKDETITLCVGGHLTNQQLGLLLGICNEAKFVINGFIDMALGQSLSVPSIAQQNDYHVLDIELHRMILGHISIVGNVRQHQQSVTMDGIGVANIIEGWMNVIADEFVHKTRFDPLHAGHSEQQLFDQVMAWLALPELKDQRVTMVNGESNRDIEISRQLLVEKLRQRLRSFDFAHVDTLVITTRVAGIPGLQLLLEEQVAKVVVLTEGPIAKNYALLAENLDAEDMHRITQVTVSEHISPASNESSSDVNEATATHLLLDHVAYAFGREQIAPHIDPATARTRSTEISVNGSFGTTLEICTGDNICIDGKSYIAIRLE